MNCDTCTHRPDPVPFAVHESAMARMERTIRRLWILLILLVVLLVGSNALWIWHEAQFEKVEVTQENEDGYNSFIGNDGDIYNGKQTIKYRRRKTGGKSGYRKCNLCKGTGRIKVK